MDVRGLFVVAAAERNPASAGATPELRLAGSY
jgi:hypothetical protein